MATKENQMKQLTMVMNFLKTLFSKILSVDFTFFHFTEADARILLSAYGVGPVEIDDLENGVLEQIPPSSKSQLSRLPRTNQAVGPISIGVHPHIVSGEWTESLAKIRRTATSNRR
jgi:hypothetical protein